MVDYVDPFISSSIAVFRTMLSCEIQQGEAARNEHFQPQHDISGVIGLSGEVSGTVILSVATEVALNATEALLGYRPESVNEDVVDAVGELTNMIAGGAKTELTSFNMCLALPAVISGANHLISFGSRVRPVLIPFTTAWGEFSVEVGFVECDAFQRAVSRYREQNPSCPATLQHLETS